MFIYSGFIIMVSIYLWWLKKTCKMVDILLECILCVKNFVSLLFMSVTMVFTIAFV